MVNEVAATDNLARCGMGHSGSEAQHLNRISRTFGRVRGFAMARGHHTLPSTQRAASSELHRPAGTDERHR